MSFEEPETPLKIKLNYPGLVRRAKLKQLRNLFVL